MRNRSLRTVSLCILVAALLATCGGVATPPGAPTVEGSPTPSCPSVETITVSLATPQPADVLLELAWEGGLTQPELAHAFGRVPEFSLLPDGRVYYRDPSAWDQAQIMEARLAPAETAALVERLLDLGIDRLESYTGYCQPQADGMCLCVADAGQSVLRVRLPGGEVREIRNYADFANDPQALGAIRTLLQDYQHPQARPYTPDHASLFGRPVPLSPDSPPLDWPLTPAWLAGGTPDASCVRVLSGGDLQALLGVIGRNLGEFTFRVGEQGVSVYLVPWLPGVDYTDLIASSELACPEGGGASPPAGEITLPTPAAAIAGSPQQGAEQAWNVSYVGQFGGRSDATAVRGNHAYLGVGPRLVILDVSRPTRATMLGQTLPLPGLVRGLAVGMGRVYVAADSAGLSVVDVSDPAHPFQIGLLDTPGQALGVAVSQGHAYVADGEAGLRVVNIYRPALPLELGFYDTPGTAYGVAVTGRYAYVADGVTGLRVVDVANPGRPLEVGFNDTPGEAWGVAVAGHYAYVADRDGGLRVVDVSDPEHPVEVGFYDTPDMATSVAVAAPAHGARGGYAYVANGAMGAGLLIVDVADPTHPQPVGATTESSASVVVAGRYAYAADWENGLRIVDISSPCQPRQVGFYHTSGSAVGVAVARDHAYLSAWGGGLHIADVSDPAHIVEAGFLEGQGWYKHATVLEDYAYGACGWGGLRAVSIADPVHPTEVGVYITPGHAEDVAVWSTDDPPGLYAAVANALEGLRLVDVSDPAHPVEVGSCDTPGQAFGVAVADGYAYVADDQAGLRVLYVADPKHPVELGASDTPMNAFDVAVAADPAPGAGRAFAYVADGGSGLRVVDVSDSTHPIEVGFWTTPGPAISVVIRDSTAYVAAGDGGLRVVDISEPSAPKEVGYYDTQGWAQQVTLADDNLYIADDAGGLLVLRFGEGSQ